MDLDNLRGALGALRQTLSDARGKLDFVGNEDPEAGETIGDCLDEIGYAIDEVEAEVPEEVPTVDVLVLSPGHVASVANALGLPDWYVREHWELLMTTVVVPAAAAWRESNKGVPLAVPRV